MKVKNLIVILVGIMGCSIWQSCQETVEPLDTSLLLGRWLVVGAERNANETKTLNEAYFEFSSDSTMQTNFTGQESTASFTTKGNWIKQISGEKLSFDILQLSADSLVITTKLMNYDFKLFLANERLDPFDKLDEELDNLKSPLNSNQSEEIHEGHSHDIES